MESCFISLRWDAIVDGDSVVLCERKKPPGNILIAPSLITLSFPGSRWPDFGKTPACGKCHRVINLSSAWLVLSAFA